MQQTNIPKLELVTLGDELLLGLYPNGHLQYLGEELARRGLPIDCNTVIKDDPADIATHFAHIWEHADIVITTGGLGPTSDDNTREAISACLGLELELDLLASSGNAPRTVNADPVFAELRMRKDADALLWFQFI